MLRAVAAEHLTIDARQVKATARAREAIGGEVLALSAVFQSWVQGMTDALASQAREALRNAQFAVAAVEDE